MITEQAQPQTGPRDAAAGTVLLGAQIVATDVSAEDYMQRYAATFHEWIAGVVIKMSPASLEHNALMDYLQTLMRVYLELRPQGTLIRSPFVMRLPDSRREPDLMLVLEAHYERINETYLDGPADIAIEIVSPSNEEVDYGAKLREYEAGGVPEYWIIDPTRQIAIFFRLTEGRYVPQVVTDEPYTTPLLPGFALDLPTLWQDPLPTVLEIVESVREMTGESVNVGRKSAR